MKILVLTLASLMFFLLQVQAQQDTLYMYRNGDLIIKRAVEDIDSIIFYSVDSQEVGKVIDIDGNEYKTVKIGNQVWMAENLKVTRYRNGYPIPKVLTNATWEGLKSGAYSIYPHDNIEGINSEAEMIDFYGLLYNFYAVRNDNGLCPTGWHVPSESEIDQLRTFIGITLGGLELKSCKQINSIWGGDCNTSNHPRWNEHEVYYGADRYGFSALPTGHRGSTGIYSYIGRRIHLWTNTPKTGVAVGYHMRYDDSRFLKYNSYEYTMGFGVRCVKD